MSKPPNRRRSLWLAAAVLLALPFVAEIFRWLLVIPFVMWGAPYLEAAGYLTTPYSHHIAGWTLSFGGLVAGGVACWWAWRRVSSRPRRNVFKPPVTRMTRI